METLVSSVNQRGDSAGPAVQTLRWFALYVRSHWEKKVHRELTRKSIESFLPLVRRERQWSDRRKIVEEPLFSGYVFARVDERDRLRVVQTDGGVCLVGMHGKPSPIPDRQIEWLRLLVRHPESLRREEGVCVGEKVRIVSGPFAGMEGTVVMGKGSRRFCVSIDAIRQSVTIDIGSEVLQLYDKEKS